MNTYGEYIEKADILIEALPYIQHFAGKTVVVKYGGAAMTDGDLTQKILQDITLLKFVGVNPILVHGGGPEINRLLGALNIEPKFADGLRITDGATMEVVQMTLTGKINKDIVARLNVMGARAIGLCGIDACLITAKKRESDVDLGLVGDVTSINTRLLEFLTKDEYIPVIAPVGVGTNGESYNINADTAAAEIAAALKAEKLIFLTDTEGICENPKDPSSLVSVMSSADIRRCIGRGSISGGMIPKATGCVNALERGVNRTHILNGTIPHPVILELFTESGIGTMVTK